MSMTMVVRKIAERAVAALSVSPLLLEGSRKLWVVARRFHWNWQVRTNTNKELPLGPVFTRPIFVSLFWRGASFLRTPGWNTVNKVAWRARQGTVEFFQILNMTTCYGKLFSIMIQEVCSFVHFHNWCILCGAQAPFQQCFDVFCKHVIGYFTAIHYICVCIDDYIVRCICLKKKIYMFTVWRYCGFLLSRVLFQFNAMHAHAWGSTGASQRKL